MSTKSENPIRLGNRTRIQEEIRDASRLRILEDALRDTVYGIRRLRRSPAFTVTAVLTLALAIGANVSIFTVVERVVLNPLPYPDSNRLIQLDHGFPSLNVPSGVGLTVGLAAGFGLPFSYARVAPLRDGATVEGARRELNGLIADLPQAYPGDPVC